MDSSAFYDRYYTNQVGNGIPVYHGGYQYGQGLGNVLGGLVRFALPFLKTGAKALGKTALRTGADIMSDTLTGRNIKTSAKRRLKQAGRDIGSAAVKEVKSRVRQRGGGRGRGRGRMTHGSTKRQNIKRRKVKNKPIRRRVGRVRTLQQPDIFGY